MRFKVKKSDIKGRVFIPGSKSHTIRALFLATLANGESEILKPLDSQDGRSALTACQAFGGDVKVIDEGYRIKGVTGRPAVPENVIDVGNSGTTIRFALSAAGLIEGYTVLTGDDQIRSRPLGPLIEALNNLGGHIISTRLNGMAPVIVRGRVTGGSTRLDAVTSQYLSSLLINCPFMENDSEIQLTRLNERPYVDITLWWLDKLGIKYSHDDYQVFTVPGGQSISAFKEVIPGDFSSATFFLVLAAVSGGEIGLDNLDMTDPQGDKLVISILEDMGAKITIKDKSVLIKGEALKGREIDMNSIPDALPAMAVAACFAKGETRLVNVPQARLKETDRIKVMYEELSKMGADITELEDGLVVRESRLRPAVINGHHDHRIVMAAAVAGLNLDGETVIETAESAAVTFPTFAELIGQCGGAVSLEEQE